MVFVLSFPFFASPGKKIPSNLRDIVYYAGLQYGGETEWNFMFEQYKRSTVPTEQKTLMFALAATSDAGILKKYLDMTLDDTIIKQQDTCYVISKIAGNPKGRHMAYRYNSSFMYLQKKLW